MLVKMNLLREKAQLSHRLSPALFCTISHFAVFPSYCSPYHGLRARVRLCCQCAVGPKRGVPWVHLSLLPVPLEPRVPEHCCRVLSVPLRVCSHCLLHSQAPHAQLQKARCNAATSPHSDTRECTVVHLHHALLVHHLRDLSGATPQQRPQAAEKGPSRVGDVRWPAAALLFPTAASSPERAAPCTMHMSAMLGAPKGTTNKTPTPGASHRAQLCALWPARLSGQPDWAGRQTGRGRGAQERALLCTVRRWCLVGGASRFPRDALSMRHGGDDDHSPRIAPDPRLSASRRRWRSGTKKRASPRVGLQGTSRFLSCSCWHQVQQLHGDIGSHFCSSA